MTDTQLKHSSARLDYTVGFSRCGLQTDEEVIDASWDIEGPDDSLAIDGVPTMDEDSATAWFIGGTDWNNYTVTCLVTTNQGRVIPIVFLMLVRNKS